MLPQRPGGAAVKEHGREEPRIVAAAERQMHAWAMKAESEDRAVGCHGDPHSASRPIRFITISREAGAGGSEIGQLLGQRLGWKVFDRNLLDQIADRFRVCRRMLDLVDETQSSWVYDVLGTWMDCQVVAHEKYFSLLTRAVSAAAAGCDHAVFVGRGTQFLLPRRELLAVRLIASPKFRVRQLMERLHLNESDARRMMRETDTGRREFVERFLHHDVTDPHFYDLVVNVESTGRENAIAEILSALKLHEACVAT
jgi:hypothetical protein